MILGKKQVEQLITGFSVTVLSYGLASFIGMIYLTDWKPVVAYIPYYNIAFAEEKTKKSC